MQLVTCRVMILRRSLMNSNSSISSRFFDPLHQAAGAGYPGETIDALWSLVWRGLVTNDSLHALRAYTAKPDSARTPRRLQTGSVFRPRRTTPPTAQGRWSLLPLRNITPRPASSRSEEHTSELQSLRHL